MGHAEFSRHSIQGTNKRYTSGGEAYDAFVPNPLPPSPEVEILGQLRRELPRPDQMVGRLDGLPTLIRHPEMLIRFYMQKEAVLSSQTEGRDAGAGRGSTLQVLLQMREPPYTSAVRLSRATGLSVNAVSSALGGLKERGIMKEVRGAHGRLFSIAATSG